MKIYKHLSGVIEIDHDFCQDLLTCLLTYSEFVQVCWSFTESLLEQSN